MGWRSASALVTKTLKVAVTTPALETMSVGPGATSAIAATQLTKNNINNAFKVTGNGSSEFMIQLKQTSTGSATLSYLASPNVMVNFRIDNIGGYRRCIFR